MRDPILYQGREIVGRMPLFKDFLRAKIRTDEKTQTRRVGKIQGDHYVELGVSSVRHATKGLILHATYSAYPGKGTARWAICECPYGMPGDVRCMTEPLKELHGYAIYQDDETPAVSLVTGKPIEWRWQGKMLPSIHMPTEAARTVVEYSEIRAQRLQAISENDALEEGICEDIGVVGANCDGGSHTEVIGYIYWHPLCHGKCFESSVEAFSHLWDSINKKRGHAWDLNEWVWAITFRRIKAPEPALI